MGHKKVLLLDIDNFVCFPGFLQSINDFLNTDYEIDDFTDYYMDEVAIPKEQFAEFTRFVGKRNLYENAQILPYAIEALERLNEHYEIYPCSDCINPFDVVGSGRIFADKYELLCATIPFISPRHFIFTSSKQLFRADVQIDDRLSNLNDHVETKILFPSYHNRDVSDQYLAEKNILRAGEDWRAGWIEVEKILLKQSTDFESTRAIQYTKK